MQKFGLKTTKSKRARREVEAEEEAEATLQFKVSFVTISNSMMQLLVLQLSCCCFAHKELVPYWSSQTYALLNQTLRRILLFYKRRPNSRARMCESSGTCRRINFPTPPPPLPPPDGRPPT